MVIFFIYCVLKCQMATLAPAFKLLNILCFSFWLVSGSCMAIWKCTVFWLGSFRIWPTKIRMNLQMECLLFLIIFIGIFLSWVCDPSAHVRSKEFWILTLFMKVNLNLGRMHRLWWGHRFWFLLILWVLHIHLCLIHQFLFFWCCAPSMDQLVKITCSIINFELFWVLEAFFKL